MQASTTALQTALEAIAPGGVWPAGPDDVVAGVRPRVVVEPASEDEVAALLAYADREGLAVLPRGGGTQSHLGAPPTRGDLLLSTRRLSGVIEHAPHDQTVSVQAGTPLAALQAQLAQAGQWLALDPALPPAATIGGIIATNATGAHRLRHGGVRDQIIGVRVALTDGTVARGGGKVVKNVAGYDLPKLFTDALGTLGVVVSAMFRLYPLPAATRTLVYTSDDPAPLLDLALRVNASTLVPAAMDLLAEDAAAGPFRLAVRFASAIPEAVADQAAALDALAGKGWPADESAPTGLRPPSSPTRAGDRANVTGASVPPSPGGVAVRPASPLPEGEDDGAAFWRAAGDLVPQGDVDDGSLLLKVSLLPSAQADWLARLRAVAREHGLRARLRMHAGHGISYLRLAGSEDARASTGRPYVEALDALREAAAQTRGSLVVQDAPLSLLSTLDVWGPIPALAVMRRLKAQFDPHAILNPGRFAGGI
ncbi:MAG TPA: FAD-binding oxidoreductase [Ktedonobacterales bacterium]